MNTTPALFISLALSALAYADDDSEETLRTLIATKIRAQFTTESSFHEVGWVFQPANDDPSIEIRDGDRTSVIVALRAIAKGERTLTGVEQRVNTRGMSEKLKKAGIPADLLRRSALAVLIRTFGDDYTIREFIDNLPNEELDLTWKLEILDCLTDPRNITHLIRIVQKADFALRKSSPRLISGPSGLAVELILRYVARGSAFSQRTRTSALKLDQAWMTREQMAWRVLQWYEANKDQFADEDFGRVSEVWIPELDKSHANRP